MAGLQNGRIAAILPAANPAMSDFRSIPSIEQLRQRPAVRALEERFGTEATLDALRTGAAAVRRELGAGTLAPSMNVADDLGARIEQAAAAELTGWFRPSLERVINATGVIIHTNLGRAPLAESAIVRVADVAGGYASLEYDVARGERGRRDVHADALLRRLTGAEAAVVVNNNAAATMIILSALAAGREVVVSRGELVEIGGGFRVPDVMAQSGAILREVGTTNKTRASDYAAAINEKTALILRVHPSNFRIEGFTERPTVEDLVAVGRKCHIPVAEDLGSGHLSRKGSDPGSDPFAFIYDEPAVEDSLAAGVDVCCFSGDKLLGGPQAGIIVGRAALVDRIRTHPLMRALRVDKMTYAALEATLSEYVADRAADTVPVQRMLRLTADEIRPRAQALADQLHGADGWRADLVAGSSAIGGGSAPGIELPTWLVAVEKRGLTADALAAQLRGLTPPIVARIERDRLVLDLRTVPPDQDQQLSTLLRNVPTQG
jgi:L-seryl-tRNA(Ser) seleniumtransferase